MNIKTNLLGEYVNFIDLAEKIYFKIIKISFVVILRLFLFFVLII